MTAVVADHTREPVPPDEPIAETATAEPIAETATAEPTAATDAGHGLVDFRGTGQRLRVGAVLVGVLVLVVWGVLAVTTSASLRQLAEFAGLGLLAMVALEVVVVGGAAARGMLAAGERGERLSQGDVSMLPPQLTRRPRR